MTDTSFAQPLRIFLAGHQGMVGRALYRLLEQQPGIELLVRSRKELDLTRQADVEHFFAAEKPDWVIIAAAKVGGILANQNLPADFIYQNLMIEANIVHSSWQTGVKRLMLLGSSCIYPKFAEQPMQEECLLSGVLEPTNEPYAVAKIAGIKLCESYQRQFGSDFRSVMPTNLYGPWDNFHPEHSHVVPGLMRRLHDAVVEKAPAVSVWGSGKARREFLHVDDLAAAVWLVMQQTTEHYASLTSPQCSHINVGSGHDISIAELAVAIAEVVGFRGELLFDSAMPEGTPRKLLAVDKMTTLGWLPQITLRQGLKDTYQWWLAQQVVG
ncbi:MAG: GDP-L-fucose synthase [Rheinheimera sp.]|nr:MAG: GDP-L-fucose synthase [Rheinheimera sp.]